MAIFLALAGILLIAFLADRRKAKARASSNQSGRVGSAARMIPHALTMLVMVAHASEITRVVSHVSTAHVLIALGLFAVWAVSNSTGSEEV